MDNILLNTHSILRWVILLLLLVAIFRNFGAGNRTFNSTDRKTGLFLTIACDIMLLIGLYQWFTGGYGLHAIQNNGMGAVMKDSVMRFYAVEHITMMVIAIILVHIGNSYGKKNISNAKKHSKTAVLYIIALLIMLAAVPWPFREAGMGRGWI
ncbi:MAG: hypothetical protein ACK5NK_02505 [Niabella sp.]